MEVTVVYWRRFPAIIIFTFNEVETVLLCIKTTKNSGPASPFAESLPYYDLVSRDPTIKEMREVVVTQGVRPYESYHWRENNVRKIHHCIVHVMICRVCMCFSLMWFSFYQFVISNYLGTTWCVSRNAWVLVSKPILSAYCHERSSLYGSFGSNWAQLTAFLRFVVVAFKRLSTFGCRKCFAFACLIF